MSRHNHKGSVSPQHTSNGFSIRPKVFVFFDKKTSAPRFEVKADADGKMPLDQVVGLLAMNCMLRGQTPEDYTVMVTAGEDLPAGLARRAAKLIHASLALNLPTQLSQRQNEVLRGVLENPSNKEIAARLHFSERTAKFHVSTLLHKFNVESRVELMRAAEDLLTSGRLTDGGSVTQINSGEKRGANEQHNGRDREMRAANATERRAAKSILAGD
jgi:DNA-binding CsgD family transcriptional regulator